MKLKIMIILVFCILLTGLNSQLFDALVKQTNLRTNIRAPIKKIPIANNNPTNVPGSLFQNFFQKSDHKLEINAKTQTVKKVKNNVASIFGGNQKNSLKTEEKHIFENPNNQSERRERHVNKRKINDEIQIFLEKSKKISSKIKKNEKTLSSLNSRIDELEEKNVNLMNDIKKYKALKKEKKSLESKVLNFVEKYQGEVKNIKSTILDKTTQVQKTISDNKINFENEYKNVVSNYSTLQTQVDLVKDKLDEIKKLENAKFNQMRKKLVLEELTIKNKFDLNGVAFINKINTDSVSMGSIKIDSNKLMFSNEAAKIMVGDDVITAKEFFKIVKSMKNLQIKCGENLEKCKPIDNNYLIKQEKKEIDILESLKTLKETTNKFLTHRND